MLFRSIAHDAFSYEPTAVATTMWNVMKDTLRNKLSKDTINKYESLADDIRHDEAEGLEYDSDAAHELHMHMQRHMKDLSPNEIVNLLDHLHVDSYDNDAVYKMLSEQFPSGFDTSHHIQAMNRQLGLKPKSAPLEPSSFNVTPEEFSTYMDRAYEHAELEKAKRAKE